MTPGRDIEPRAREALEASIEQLDARVRSRLTRARHAALDELQRHPRRPAWLIAPAAGLAAAAAAAVAVVLWAPWSVTPEPRYGTALTAQAALPGDELDFLLGEDVFATVFEEPAG